MAIVAGLLVLVFAVYAQLRTHGFINFDDPLYVSGNEHVLGGLSWSGITWAFTRIHADYWIPITWISHMLDVQLFGPDAGAQLMMSAALHAVDCVLIFLFLRMATGALWRSAAAAALFAVHPLHVESVAWISERKDTLSTLFFLLCLIAYTVWVAKRSRAAYGAAVAALALGLMAKPMLVTVPFVLLLLDYWPFHRLDRSTARARIVEKVPFALCVLPQIAATLFAQREAMPATNAIPLLARMANAAISYVWYVGKTFWPSNLAVLYPMPTRIDPFTAILCGVLVIAVTAAAFRVRRSMPWLFVGWCWFAGMLVPVSGIVQVGVQARADRFTYQPHIGLFIAIVWAVAAIAGRVPKPRIVVPAAAVSAIVLLALAAHAQAEYWKGTVPLFEHALAVTGDNKLAHVNLGEGLLERGDYAAAEREYRAAVGMQPAETVEIGLALALAGEGKLDAAAASAERAAKANPNSAAAAAAAGSIALARGDMAAAERALGHSVALKRDPAVAARLALARGNLETARAMFDEALVQRPGDADLHNSLGAVLGRLGADGAALDQYAEALRLNPNLYDARMNYGALLSRAGRNAEAQEQFAAAGRIRPESAEPHVYAALLGANEGRFGDAAAEIEAAIRIDHDGSNRFLISAIRIPQRPTAIDEYLAFLRQRNGGK